MNSFLRSTLACCMLGSALTQGTALADTASTRPEQSRPAPEATGTLSWAEDLTQGQGRDMAHTREGLLFEPSAAMRGSSGQRGLTGLYTFPARRLERAVDTVRPLVRAELPPGTDLEVDVRVRTEGGGWSEWSTGRVGEDLPLPRSGTEVQVRLALLADDSGRGPQVREVRLEGSQRGVAPAASYGTLAALSYRVYATREGLVGGQTANGHIIKSNDHFVALPSRRGLADNGSTEYQVKVCYSKTGKCTTAPVWDVGPWNTKDDYWNPSSTRQMWKDLPQGKPEAQAAYQDNYNGGKDQYGRRPPTPAGIDLADGVFWGDLGMTDNDWVQVTYLWTEGGTPPPPPPPDFTGSWFLRDANSAGANNVPTFSWASDGDIPVSGDWNGDGIDTVGVYRPSNRTWYLCNTLNGTGPIISFAFGTVGAIPVVGDFDGDGKDTVGLYVGGTWFLKNTNAGSSHDISFAYGSYDSYPVVGDWNGDGKDTIGVYNGYTWLLRNTNSAGPHDLSIAFGSGGDIPVVGDWNKDGVDSIGVFRKGTWFMRNSNSPGPHDITFAYGRSTDLPLIGDWNGDGIDTIGVAR